MLFNIICTLKEEFRGVVIWFTITKTLICKLEYFSVKNRNKYINMGNYSSECMRNENNMISENVVNCNLTKIMFFIDLI